MKALAASLVLILSGCVAARPEASHAPVAEAPSPDAQAVIEATQQVFDAMEARDSTALYRLLHPSAQIIGVAAGGRVGVSPGGRDAWVRDVVASGERLRERIVHPRVEVDGDLATLWARYDFHVDEAYSHCGTDAFQFVRDGAAWRLIVVTFTIQTEGCPEALAPAP